MTKTRCLNNLLALFAALLWSLPAAAAVRVFPEPQEMLERMRQAGFREVSWTPYSFGIARLYRGKK